MASVVDSTDEIMFLAELEDGEIKEDDEENVRDVLLRPRVKPNGSKDGGHGSDAGLKVKSKARKNRRDVKIAVIRGGSSGGGPSSSRSTKENFRIESKQSPRVAFTNSRASDNCRKHREAAPLPPRPSFSPNRHSRRESPLPHWRKEELSWVNNSRTKFDRSARNDRRDDRPPPTFGRLDNRSRSKQSPPRSAPRVAPRSTSRPASNRAISDYTSKRHRFLSTIRRKPPIPFKPLRKPTAEETSYDDLLKQYQAIKSKLDDLNQEENDQVSDISSDDLEDLDKENVKSSTKENKQPRDHESHDAHISRCTVPRGHDSKPPSVQTRSSSRSSRNSTESKTHVDKEEDDEDEEEILLRNLLLSTMKNRTQKRPSNAESGSPNVPREQAQSKLADETVLVDNYDDVEMELDSRSSSPLLFSEMKGTDSTEPEAVPAPPLVEEDDEDLLRAMLLSSLTSKQLVRTKVPDEPAPSPEIVPPSKASSSASAKRKTRTSTPTNNGANPKMPVSAPVHRPVVINLNEDSDSDAETACAKKPSLLSIDDLLNSARLRAGTNLQPNHKVSSLQTPSVSLPASEYLPKSELTEYKRLRAEILKREGGKRTATSRTESEAELTPGNNSPVRVPTPVIKDDSKLRKTEETMKMNKRAILSCTRELKKLEVQIGSKSSSLSTTELKVAKLKEQLLATTKFADAQRRQLERMKQSFKVMEKQMSAKNSLQRSLEQQCRNLGAEIHGPNYQLSTNTSVSPPPKRKLSSTVELPSNSKKKLVTPKAFNGNGHLQITRSVVRQMDFAPGSPNVGASLEKARLQKMEKEIAAKLEELRRKASNVSSRASATRKAVTGPNRSPGNVAGVTSRQVTLVYDNARKGVTDSPVFKKNAPTGLILTCRNDLALPSVTGGADDPTVANPAPAVFSDNQLTRLKEMQGELDKLQPVTTALVDKAYTFDMHSMFDNELPKVTVKLPKIAVGSTVVETEQFGCGTYSSPLLHLRSYRFSPYFRTKANQSISWPTHSHKLKTMVRLCRFDLLGTCNDDKCPWQHERDYTMSAKEVLCDILSYCPSLAYSSGSTSPEDMKTNIETYVDKLQHSHQDRMTLDQLCVLLIGRVNERLCSVPPHYCKFEPRLFLPTPVNGLPEANQVPYVEKKKAFKKVIICEADPDANMEDNDVRYFHEGQVNSLEMALSETPEDTNLWLRHAYKMLNTPSCAPEMCLDMALDVLSRGLEQNRYSSDLWLLYLSLYDKHDNNGDILQLYEQAVRFCNSYEVWWKYLQYARGFVMKEVVCRDVFAYLMGSSEPPEILSHHLLEMLLYRVQLNMLCGRTNIAVTILKQALGKSHAEEDSHQVDLVDLLVSSDCCLAWLCYANLLEFGQLPPFLFSLSNGGLGRLVNKTPFILPWDAGHKFKFSFSTIQNIFSEALRKCVRRNQTDTENVQLCLPIYKNLFALEICRGRNSSAIKACEQLLKVAMPDDVWMVLACVYFKTADFEQVRKTLSRALKSSEASPRLYCFAAMFEMSQNNVDAAHAWVTSCAISLFDFPENDEEVAVLDAVALYSKMLGLPVILNTKVPAAKSLQHIISQKPFIWLNYCIYLTVLGKHDDAKDAFEMALVRVTRKEDLELVWLHYLQYSLCRLTTSSSQQRDFENFDGLVHRCLSSVPSSVSLPGSPTKLWSNYTFFNSVVDLYANILDVNQQIAVCERFHELAPKNDLLTDKLLMLYMQQDEYQKAWLLCQLQIQNASPSLYVWKTTLHMAHKEKSPAETRKLFCQAVKVLPHVSIIWKEYIVFECLQNRVEDARRLVIECKTYGIVLDDFFDQLLFS